MARLDWTSLSDQSARWRAKGSEYAAAINRFVAVGKRDGWDAAGAEPREQRSRAEVEAVLDVVRSYG